MGSAALARPAANIRAATPTSLKERIIGFVS
jgi:hypothetical protein